MENARTQTAPLRNDFNPFIKGGENDDLTLRRLDDLLALNAKTAREKSLFHNEREKVEASLMTNPLTDKQAFAYFGLLLGTLPPAVIFTRFFMEANFRNGEYWIIGVVAIINLISAIVGYFSGKLVGKMVGSLEEKSWTKMLLALPFVGILWGIMAGGAGGVIVFVVGAIFGAALGAMVGGAALPMFAVFHRLLKKGDVIDRKHFYPLAFGITFVICAFIFGLTNI